MRAPDRAGRARLNRGGFAGFSRRMFCRMDKSGFRFRKSLCSQFDEISSA